MYCAILNRKEKRFALSDNNFVEFCYPVVRVVYK